MRSNFSFFFFLVLLSSCSTNNWISDTKSESELDEDLLSCTNSSNESYPPRYVIKSEPSFAPVNSPSPPSYPNGGKSSLAPHYSPTHQTRVIDSNTNVRKASLEKCMKDKDWKMSGSKK
ncbi:MAG: hypothetical protein SFT91_03120 [Rickettsiaceae bacterium]|nr:hypothetical protein [Rickettsiaceae bacterium]